MNIIADTHCHTIASNHAYSTIGEIIGEAKRKNLYAVAVTDHNKSIPVSWQKGYFRNLRCIPDVVEGIRLLKGIELNIIDHLGNTDDDPKENINLNWKIASIHHTAYKGDMSFEACTNTWEEIAKNPEINVIGHCEINDFKFDYEKIIPLFGKYGKLVEINNSSFLVREHSIANLYEIANVCKRYKVPVIVNSDAHFYTQVGEFTKSLKLLKEVDFPESLVVNSSIERFEFCLKERGIL